MSKKYVYQKVFGSRPLIKSTMILMAVTLMACASSPPNKFGHHHDYPYKAPSYVSEKDEDECSRIANRDAFASIRDMSDTPSLLFGAIGATVQLVRGNSKLNSTYENSMKTCLKDKGYNIID